MKAVTVLQPIASAMIEGAKPIENRKWRPRTVVEDFEKRVPVKLPLLIAVHAGERWWNPTGASTAGPDVDGCAFTRQRWPGMPDVDTMPTRALLGVMRVSAFLDGDDLAGLPVRTLDIDRILRHPWALGPVYWVLDRVWKLPEPIACPGARGLWQPEYAHAKVLDDLVKTPGVEVTL